MRVGPKFDAFIDCIADVEFLEGTTAAGKTTVGIYKFMLEVAESKQKLHIIAGLDTGTIEKNIINKDHGILDEWGKLVEYHGAGTSQEKLPHITFHVSQNNDKVIYVLGYDDKKRWKKALGGQYGCLYIDEINIADMDFVREASMRCDYLLGTLNPDDPTLPVYDEYVNHSRPLAEWSKDTPEPIMQYLNGCEAYPGWVHWFFNFDDNISLSEQKKAKIIRNVPPGTKLYKNKIQGLRGKATGLVFSNFDRKRHVVKASELDQYIQKNRGQEEYFNWYSIGVDTAYSQQSADTIAMSFVAITNKGLCCVLDERVYNNRDLDVPIAPSDTIVNLVDFAERNRKRWGLSKTAFIDSADQATLTEGAKYRRAHSDCIYQFTGAYKKTKIIDRILLQLNYLHVGSFLVAEHCQTYIQEIEAYSWKEDKDNEPEDGNDHMVNSVQYAWLPYKDKIRGEI